MAQLATGEPVWDLPFDEKGSLTGPTVDDFVGKVRRQCVDDLFVLCHGWNTSQDDARALYDTMFPMIRDAARVSRNLGKLGFAGVYWPALWFPPTPATMPATAGSAQAVTSTATANLSAGTAQVTGAQIAAALRTGFTDLDQQRTIVEIGQLIDDGQALIDDGQTDDAKRAHLARIHELIRSLAPMPPETGQDEDTGETALLMTDDPADSYRLAATVFGDLPSGGSAQGIGDWFAAAINGAKDALRVFSFWTMKARAGTIGQAGLGPLLAALHADSPGIRVHLVGHSFGARLVSFALAGVGSAECSPVGSLMLLQGAFSHWSFSGVVGNPFGTAGTLNTFADRVHGPRVATFSIYDWAVGVWYPKASFMAGGNQNSATDPSRWGGLGADGFQPVGSATHVVMSADGGSAYGFTPGTFYRVDAAAVINNTDGQPFAGAHCDIQKSPVARLIVATADEHNVG